MILFAKQKTPPKMNGHKEASPIKRNDECGATPENPWVVGTSTQAPSSDIEICPSSVSKFMAKAKGKRVQQSISMRKLRPVSASGSFLRNLNPPTHLTRPAGVPTMVRNPLVLLLLVEVS